MDDENKLTVLIILKNLGFYDNIAKKDLKSARRRNALHDLPKAKTEIRNPPLTTIENVSDDL